MTAADRQQRYRERRKAGSFVVWIEVDADLVEALVGARFLHGADADNPEAVKDAIQRVHDFLKRHAAEM